MNAARAVVVIVVTLAVLAPLTGCTSEAGTTPALDQAGRLEAPLTAPRTRLVATDGSAFDLAAWTADARAAVAIVTVAYVHCPTLCQTGLADLATALRRVDPAVREQVRVVVLTADPERDTPRRLRRWLDRYDPSFEGVTGDPAQLRAAAAALGLPIAGRRERGSGHYEVGHGAHLVPFRDGVAAGMWPAGTSAATLRTQIAALVSAEPSGGPS